MKKNNNNKNKHKIKYFGNDRIHHVCAMVMNAAS